MRAGGRGIASFTGLRGNGVRILAFAYACEPGKGSEPGAGWAWAQMLARLGETWVITRTNNRQFIEAEIEQLAESDRPRFAYVDLPPWARLWKRGQRGVRLYYVLWQIAALRRARGMNRSMRFDLVWHLTMANAWIGSVAALVGPRFVYGPVGGGVRTPWLLFPTLGRQGTAYEALRGIARLAGRYLNPLSRVAWHRATLILAQNRETVRWLPRRHRTKASVFPNVALEGVPSRAPSSPTSRPRTALFAGRLLAWKGGALAVRTLTHLPGWRLMFIGSGPDESRLRRLARRANIADRVEFSDPVPREELLRQMGEDVDVLLFPSLHDEAGWVVAEAAASGLPAVCLDVGGPPVLGGQAVAPSTPSRTALALAEAVTETSRRTSRGQPRFGLVARAAALSELLASKGLLYLPRGQDAGGDLGSRDHPSIGSDAPGRS